MACSRCIRNGAVEDANGTGTLEPRKADVSDQLRRFVQHRQQMARWC